MGKTQKTREIPLVHFDCPTGQLTLGNVQALGHLQLSITAIAGLLATFSLMASIFYWAVGLLIFLPYFTPSKSWPKITAHFERYMSAIFEKKYTHSQKIEIHPYIKCRDTPRGCPAH